MERKTRAGGRSARVVRAAYDAVLALLAEPDWSKLTLARVAERAQVHPATVYRRWPDLALLVGAALTDLWSTESPLPDLGSLRDDVHRHAAKIAADLAGPSGSVLLRGAVLIGGSPEVAADARTVGGRVAEIEAMLQRARGRGEPCGTAQEYFECVTGPLYGYALFAPAALRPRAAQLAERFLSLPA